MLLLLLEAKFALGGICKMTVSQILDLPPRYQMAELVRYARINSGHSISSLARAVGCARSSIHKIESGEFCPRPALMFALNDATGKRVSLDAWYSASHSWHIYARSRPASEWKAERRAIRARGAY